MSQARRSTSKKQAKQAVEVTVDQINAVKEAPVDRVGEARAVLLAQPENMSKSAKIRLLHAKGYSRVDIAAAVGVIYQHVRNVLITELKRPTITE